MFKITLLKSLPISIIQSVGEKINKILKKNQYMDNKGVHTVVKSVARQRGGSNSVSPTKPCDPNMTPKKKDRKLPPHKH